jgi:putative CocE/NonD family hydrolase
MSGPHAPLPLGVLDERADHVMVPMRDAVRLATDIYLPARIPAATVLVRLPYDKSGRFSFMSRIASAFLDRGYAVVVQDVRGKARSEGERVAFVHEAPDGEDTLEWIVAQAWSTGVVGMFGDSYYGFTQWAAASTGHPALRAIVPRSTTTSLADGWVYDQGLFCLYAMAEWAATAWVDEFLYEDVPDWGVRPLEQLIPRIRDGRRSANLDRWRRTPPGDPFWSEGAFGAGRPVRERVRIPVLHSGGWWDVFQRGQVGDFLAMSRAGVSDQHLVMGATDHFDDELLIGGGPAPDIEVDDEALERFLPGYLAPALEFFDRHPVGRTVAPIPPVRWHLANEGWRTAETWPPAGAEELRLYLAASRHALDGPEGGGLAPAPDRSASDASWTHDPEELVPDLIEDVWRPLLGLPDEREVEGRHDVLTFTGEAARIPLDLAGPTRLEAVVAGEGPRMHLMAKLVDVDPAGRARRILQGGALVAEPSSDRPVRVELGHTGYRLAPGHRLRLEVASSDHPRYLWDPGTDEDPWSAEGGVPRRRTVRGGASASAVLTLSVLR